MVLSPDWAWGGQEEQRGERRGVNRGASRRKGGAGGREGQNRTVKEWGERGMERVTEDKRNE